MPKYTLTLWLLFFAIPFCYSNNLQISPVTVSTSGGNQHLNFAISWDNSWRMSSSPGNWDAVWVFVKRRDCAGLTWHHANLSDNDADHTAGSPLFVDAYTDKKGVMIYRSADSAGNISNVNISLQLDSVPAGNYEYKVFGIEMVYINRGAFYVGDGVSYGTIRQGFGSLDPFHIISEDAISTSPNNTSFWAAAGLDIGEISTIYPKGFNAFYCMKYEISQGQYADFLNTIAQDAAVNRYDPANFNVNRYTITGLWPAIKALLPDRACNWLSFRDIAAYMDWSALSPMSELEYEKVCRGSDPALPVAGECAWGGNVITDADSIVAGTDGTSGEIVGNIIGSGSGIANFDNNSVLGPLRCGFAARAGTDKFSAGASYYGVMELSGNVYEGCYSVDNVLNLSSSRYFNGSSGDGELSITPNPGFANQGWPEEAPPGNPLLFTFAFKGGAWSSPATELAVSDRSYTLNTNLPPADTNGRSAASGGRGVSRRQ